MTKLYDSNSSNPYYPEEDGAAAENALSILFKMILFILTPSMILFLIMWSLA